MSSVYFMADAHLDHKNITKFRTCFSDVEEHNSVIKENYHKVVNKRDTVYMLGDMCFSHEALKEIKAWHGRKILICGNHDLERGITMQDLCNAYDAVYSLFKYKSLWLSHCPLHPNELRGKKNIHGHVHFQSIPDSRYFNASLENINYTPINVEEIRKRLTVAAMSELTEVSQEMKLYD